MNVGCFRPGGTLDGLGRLAWLVVTVTGLTLLFGRSFGVLGRRGVKIPMNALFCPWREFAWVLRSVVSVLALCCFATPAVRADQVSPPSAWVVTSPFGDHLFKMVPAEGRFVGDKYVITKEAFGVAYEVDRKGDFVERWRTKGWFAQCGWLSEDGRYFVRKGPWASDYDGRTDLAVAFYDRGKLLKEYRVKDLIKNPEALVQTASHYFWSPEVQTAPDGLASKSFHLVMADKTTYQFNIATGEITETGRDAGAKTMLELEAERGRNALARGQKLWSAFPARVAMEKLFEVTRPSADPEMSMSSVHFDGPEWCAYLEPKKALAFPVQVGAVIPVVKGDELAFEISPEELLGALERLVAHPWVKTRWEEDEETRPSGIRVRITGDRLHWDTGELLGLFKLSGKYPSKNIDVKALRPWCQAIVDEPGQRYTSLFFNVQTGDLILPDRSVQGAAPLCLDKMGVEK